ncbi:GntR family transcriptional regulator, partial [Paenibacillus sp. 28ISP30-2]|nr:GntR family transcriptional regulator [Paenibacillus sp. 28ISP30-2]
GALPIQEKKESPTIKISRRGIRKKGTIFEISEIVAVDYKCTYLTAFNNEHHKRRNL